jgi:hypothetical protein
MRVPGKYASAAARLAEGFLAGALFFAITNIGYAAAARDASADQRVTLSSAR